MRSLQSHLFIMVFVEKKSYSVERYSKEWDAMWAELATLPLNEGDRVCEDPSTGACWEYLGSSAGDHHFRHRHHPKTLQQERFVAKAVKEFASV